MSEYAPITGELRVMMDTLGWYDEDGNIVFTTGGTPASEIACLAINSKTFDRLCDSIDAVHAGLERENAELRARVAEAELDNRSESMHIGGSITDELRKFIEDPLLGYAPQDQHIELLTKIADRIDAEHERQLEVLYRDMSDAEYVKLPVDADGVPIRIGDEMEGVDKYDSLKEVMGKVITVSFESDGTTDVAIRAWDSDGKSWHRAYLDPYASVYRHHHAPTVEDVMVEFATDWECAQDGEDKAAVLKEYAAKLRLAGDAE